MKDRGQGLVWGGREPGAGSGIQTGGWRLTPFGYFQRHSPSRIPCHILQRVAGTGGTYKGKKKGDPNSEPGVLTLVSPPTFPPSAPSPPPSLQEAGAAESLVQNHIGQT